MILTTTPTIEGRTIAEYKGIVFGEVIAGVNFVRDIAASIRNFVGGRSNSYEEELVQAINPAADNLLRISSFIYFASSVKLVSCNFLYSAVNASI